MDFSRYPNPTFVIKKPRGDSKSQRSCQSIHGLISQYDSKLRVLEERRHSPHKSRRQRKQVSKSMINSPSKRVNTDVSTAVTLETVQSDKKLPFESLVTSLRSYEEEVGRYKLHVQSQEEEISVLRTEMKRLEEYYKERLETNERIFASKLEAKKLKFKERLEAGLLEQKIQLRSLYAQKNEQLIEKMENLRELECKRLKDKLACSKKLEEEAIRGKVLEEVKSSFSEQVTETEKANEIKLEGIIVNIKTEYERKNKTLKQRINELLDENKQLKHRIDTSDLRNNLDIVSGFKKDKSPCPEVLCTRCKAFVELQDSLDSKISRINSFLKYN